DRRSSYLPVIKRSGADTLRIRKTQQSRQKGGRGQEAQESDQLATMEETAVGGYSPGAAAGFRKYHVLFPPVHFFPRRIAPAFRRSGAASLNHPRHGNGRCGRSRYPCGQRSESTVRSRRSAPSIHPFFQEKGPYPSHPPPVRNPSAEDVKRPRFARHPRHSRRPIDRGEAPVPGSSGGGPSSGSGQRGRQIAG